MGTLRNKAGSLFRRIVSRGDIFSRARDYKFSIGAAVLCVLFEAAVVVLEDDFYVRIGFDESAVTRFLILSGMAALLAETCFAGKKWPKLLGLILGAVVAGMITFFIGVDEDSLLFGIRGVFFYKKAQELMAGCIFLMPVLTVYFSYRKTAVRFEEYMLTLFINWLMVFSLYIILLIGAGLVCSCVDTLFLGGGSSIVTVSWILISGFFLIPGGILALDGRNHVSKELLATPAQYVLSLMAVCALAVVYLYAAGILIRWEFPSNEVFTILSVLFCLGMPIWMVTGSLLGELSYGRVMALMPYAFAPLILLQIYSMGIRIGDNGLTPDRYAGVMLIVFEAGTLLCWHFRRNRMENVLLLMGVLIALTFLAPWVNRCRLSERWQQAWFEKYYEAVVKGEGLSERQAQRMYGAYLYLRDKTPGGMAGQYDDYQNSLLEESGAGGQSGIYSIYQKELQKKPQLKQYSIHGCQLVGALSLEGYQTMNMLDEASDQPETDFSQFRFLIRETGEEITIDISSFAQQCMDYIEEHPDAGKEEQSSYMRGKNRIYVDEDRVLYINHFQVSYRKGIKDGEDYFEWIGLRNVGAIMLSGED